MNKIAKILYVEDDKTLSFVTRDNLERQGFDIDYCEDGEQALEKYQSGKFDICVFDVMLPKMDGFTLAKKIRETDQQIPILFLTAKSTIEDKLHGLRLGGDDYIVKPFSIEELVLKINIFLKRSSTKSNAISSPILQLGKYKFNKNNQELCLNDVKTKLTFKEANLLDILIERKNSVIKREDILKQVWGDNYFFSGRSLDVFISKLRKYLKDDDRISIENIHGIGFRLNFEDK